jgi:hypothetical protein
VTTRTRAILHDAVDRVLMVTGTYDPNERHRMLVLGCVEDVT